MLLVPSILQAQPRDTIEINDSWRFLRANEPAAAATGYDDASWQSVNLPHTWNALDMLDDEPGYLRDTCWYRRMINIPAEWSGRKVFIRFDGANQDATLYLNGAKVGTHHGGYTAFMFDLTPYLSFGRDNLLAVTLSNAHNPEVPPVGGDLGHFGGIYRTVKLILTDPVHFEVLNHASPGIFFTPVYRPADPGGHALDIRGAVINETAKRRRQWIRFELRDTNGHVISGINEKLKLDAGERREFSLTMPVPRGIDPWSLEIPRLYTVVSYLLNGSMKQVSDRVTMRVGFRSIDVSDENGFSLNGEHTFIRGVGKHQDFDSIGYAVPDSILQQDIDWIKEMGANLVRSHYPLSSGTYDRCDELGVMAWVKLPIMDKANFTPVFMENSANMLREMILQHYNHPSIIFWGYQCEIFGDMDWYWPKPQDPEQVKQHIAETIEYTKGMELLARQLDPTRFTANDFHTDPTPEYYLESGLTDINMINGWNIYQGWYHRNLDSIGDALDEFRAYNPVKPFIIAEYGAGSDPRINTGEPTIFDFSNQYQDLFHSRYLEAVKSRPWIIGMCIWTLFDFQVDGRQDAVPHINSKGVLTADRKPKDSWHLYRANWSDELTVHIADRYWPEQWVQSDRGTAERTIRIMTNADSVVLINNGFPVSLSPLKNGMYTATMDLGPGTHAFRATGFKGQDTLTDERTFRIRILPEYDPGSGIDLPVLCINAGQSRTQLRDDRNGETWIPSSSDSLNVLGRHDGKYVTRWPGMAAWEGIREGIGSNIAGTPIDPVFQTFLKGITRYILPVAPGEYAVTLLFTEPYTSEARRSDPEFTGADPEGRRVFHVGLNGRRIVSDLDLAGDHGVRQAFEVTSVVNTTDKGILVELTPVRGLPVLSGIRIERQ